MAEPCGEEHCVCTDSKPRRNLARPTGLLDEHEREAYADRYDYLIMQRTRLSGPLRDSVVTRERRVRTVESNMAHNYDTSL